MKLERAVRAEDESRRRGTASTANSLIISVKTARKEYKVQNATNVMSVDTLRQNALNNRKSRAP